MIRPSRPNDASALQHLWQIAFGDPPSAIEAFFSHLYQPGDAIVWAEGETVASAIYLLDAGHLPQPGGKPLRASYAYALATLPDYRGRGLGAAVTKAAIQRSAALGYDCNLICPAEAGLFAYYTRLGYETAFPIAEGTLSCPPHSEPGIICQVMSTCFSIYFRLRQDYLPLSALAYPEPFLRYMAFRCETSGGGLYRLEVEGRTGCAAVERRGGQLFVPEILPAALAAPGIRALLSHLDAACANFRTLPDMTPPVSLMHQRPFVLVSKTGTVSSLDGKGYVPFVLN